MSTYCTEAQIKNVFGTTNVDNWSDLDNDQGTSTMADRVTQAIAVASERIDDAARTMEYRIPLVQTADGTTTPITIVDLAATLAGIWLYEARGVMDFDQRSGAPYHRLAFKRSEARRMIQELRTGLIQLDALR